jgi:hypothetical protein
LAIRLMHWPSYTALPSTFTSSDDHYDTAPAFFDCTSITALCFQLFQDIEARHGRHLVRATLAYVSLARFGVSESELFELLSLSDDVLTEVCVCDFFRHRASPPLSPHASYFAATRCLCPLIAPCPLAPSCSCSTTCSRCLRAKALPGTAVRSSPGQIARACGVSRSCVHCFSP